MTDLLDILAQIELTENPWTGAPLEYTTDYWTPDELVAAFERYVAEHGNFASYPQSHMWSTFLTDRMIEAGDHHCARFNADARFAGRLPCPLEHDHTGLPGDLMHQANCPDCRWHAISTSEVDIVEAWHDHALPGWRDLPVLPANLKLEDEKKAKAAVLAWVTDNYPEEWQRPGIPILTHRSADARRPVGGRSPFGGYDIAAVIA